jgi:hypothetical protein
VMSSNILRRVPAIHSSRFKPRSSRTALWSAFSEGRKRSRAAFCSIDQCGSQAEKSRYLP